VSTRLLAQEKAVLLFMEAANSEGIANMETQPIVDGAGHDRWVTVRTLRRLERQGKVEGRVHIERISWNNGQGSRQRRYFSWRLTTAVERRSDRLRTVRQELAKAGISVHDLRHC